MEMMWMVTLTYGNDETVDSFDNVDNIPRKRRCFRAGSGYGQSRRIRWANPQQTTTRKIELFLFFLFSSLFLDLNRHGTRLQRQPNWPISKSRNGDFGTGENCTKNRVSLVWPTGHVVTEALFRFWLFDRYRKRWIGVVGGANMKQEATATIWLEGKRKVNQVESRRLRFCYFHVLAWDCCVVPPFLFSGHFFPYFFISVTVILHRSNNPMKPLQVT